jgi:hypothetical protein
LPIQTPETLVLLPLLLPLQRRPPRCLFRRRTLDRSTRSRSAWTDAASRNGDSGARE